VATPHSILVPVDFGEASARAVSIAGSLARHCGATLRLLHAESLEAPPYFTSDQIAALEAQRRATRRQGEEYVARFGRAHTTHPFTPLVDDRTAVEAILHEAAVADLLIMGTHGRRGPKRWWLGSVAERVLRSAAKPLLVVHADGPQSADLAFRCGVVHAAAPVRGETALSYAHEIAGCFGGQAIDARFGPVEPAIATSSATILVVAMPAPPTAAWLANDGEPLLRRCQLPVLFVPDAHGPGTDVAQG
jgi:nucleotide-binding universal stress UspA family protein